MRAIAGSGICDGCEHVERPARAHLRVAVPCKSSRPVSSAALQPPAGLRGSCRPRLPGQQNATRRCPGMRALLPLSTTGGAICGVRSRCRPPPLSGPCCRPPTHSPTCAAPADVSRRRPTRVCCVSLVHVPRSRAPPPRISRGACQGCSTDSRSGTTVAAAAAARPPVADNETLRTPPELV